MDIKNSTNFRIDQINQQIVVRFPYLGNDHALSTKRFIDERENVPFEGRSDTLKELDAWLLDEKAPPDLLLHGPGGGGKSTLLVKWLVRLQENSTKPSGIIFIPISRRHELAKDFNFFPSLGGSLAPFLSSVPTLPDAVEDMRAFAQRTLAKLTEENTPLLIIIDGLDEADGWRLGEGFLPNRPNGHNLRILVSTRTEIDDPSGQTGCRRLGWKAGARVLPLDRLGDDAVRTLITSASHIPLLPRRLDEYVSFCGGDPLVTQILVERLKDPLVDASAIPINQAITGPLEYILREWYERILSSAESSSKLLLHRLLSTLATARGPLTRDDLAIVLDVSAGQVDELLRCLGTLITGNMDEGYGFGHPRMAETLAPVFEPNDPSIAQGFTRLIEASLTKAGGKAAGIAPYALRHAAAHVQQGTLPIETMSHLLSQLWLHAHQDHFHHVREFIALADAIGEKAREANTIAAADAEAAPLAGLEFASAVWRAAANESMKLRMKRAFGIREKSVLALQTVRESLFPDNSLPLVDPIYYLEKLVLLKEELPSDMLEEWQDLTNEVTNLTIERLFVPSWDDDKAVRLMEKVRPDFDCETHVKSLTAVRKQVVGWKYLLQSGRAHEPEIAIQEIRNLAHASGSSETKAECAVFLAGKGEVSFEQAFESILTLARLGYEGTKSAALLTGDLMETAAAPRNVAGLQRILDEFRAAARYPDMESPLLGAMLRILAPEERFLVWEAMLRLRFVSDIETVIELGPQDWSEQDVDAFSRRLAVSSTATDRAEPGADGEDAVYRHALRAARILTCLAAVTRSTARHMAIKRVLDNLEVIPISEWWSATAGILSNILPLAQYGDIGVEQIVRANELAEAYEAKTGTPVSKQGLYDLPPEKAAPEIVAFINRWGGEGLKRVESNLRYSQEALANHLAESIDTIHDPGLRRQVAEKLVGNDTLRQCLKTSLSQRFQLRDPSEEKWKSWVRSDRTSCCMLLNALAVHDKDVTEKAFRWLIGKGKEAQALLSKLTIPENWPLPADLIAPLTSILRNWRTTQPHQQFPSALAARLPADRLRDIVDDLLDDYEEETFYLVTDIMAAVKDKEAAAAIQKAYLEAVCHLPYIWMTSYRRLVLAPIHIPVIAQPGDWLACRLSHLRQDSAKTEGDIVSQIALDLGRLTHPSMVEVFGTWVLTHVDKIADPIERIKLRFRMGATMEPTEVETCWDVARMCSDSVDALPTLLDILPILMVSGSDDATRQLIDETVAGATYDNFDQILSALGDYVTVNHIRTVLQYALHVATFTGRQVPLAQYFARLPGDERDTAFEDWCRVLRARGYQEEERRFLRVAADTATSTFARSILCDLVRPDVNQSDWKDEILALLGRLSPEDANGLLETVLTSAQEQDNDAFLAVLLSRFRRRDRLRIFKSCLPLLSPRVAKLLSLSFCASDPALLDEGLVADALRMAEKDAEIDLQWICEAPAATAAQRDQAWAVLLARAQTKLQRLHLGAD